MDRKGFTINVPSEDQVRQADYFGLVSGREVDKLSAVKMTSVKSDLVDAPYVKEFPLILECRLLSAVEIGLLTQFIGEIIDVKAEAGVLADDGLPDIEKIKPIIFAPERRSYHGVGKSLGKAFSIGKRD